VAGLTAAKFLSAFFPGVGQMVIGRTVKGGILFACYVLCFGLLVLMRKDFELLMHVLVPSNHSSPGSPKWLVLVPILGAIAVWLTSMGDLFSGQSQTVARHTKVDRPKPPVDLPFD